MDPVSAVVGVVIFVVGVVVGRVRRRRPNDAPVGAAPVCGCRHHLSMHDPQTGLCHGVAWRLHTPPKGQTFDLKDECPCRHYVGPEPLSLVAAQPLAVDPATGVVMRRITTAPPGTDLTKPPAGGAS